MPDRMTVLPHRMSNGVVIALILANTQGLTPVLLKRPHLYLSEEWTMECLPVLCQNVDHLRRAIVLMFSRERPNNQVIQNLGVNIALRLAVFAIGDMEESPSADDGVI